MTTLGSPDVVIVNPASKGSEYWLGEAGKEVMVPRKISISDSLLLSLEPIGGNY